MSPKQFHIAGSAFFALAALCCVYAGSEYRENAARVEALRSNPMAQAMQNMLGDVKLEPRMPDAGRNALYGAAALAVSGIAMLAMGRAAARDRTRRPGER